MTIRQTFISLLSLLFFAHPVLAYMSKPAKLPTACSTDKDCPSGWFCDIEFVACTTNPQASECVRKVCVANTDPDSPSSETYETDTVLESGPNGSPALRIQLVWTKSDKTVWTLLHGAGLRRVLHGEKQARSRMRICSGWGTPSTKCEYLPGQVIFNMPFNNKIGETLQGSLKYRYPASGQEVTLPFKSKLHKSKTSSKGHGN